MLNRTMMVIAMLTLLVTVTAVTGGCGDAASGSDTGSFEDGGSQGEEDTFDPDKSWDDYEPYEIDPEMYPPECHLEYEQWLKGESMEFRHRSGFGDVGNESMELEVTYYRLCHEDAPEEIRAENANVCSGAKSTLYAEEWKGFKISIRALMGDVIQDFEYAEFTLYRGDRELANKTVYRDPEYRHADIPEERVFFFEPQWEPGLYRLEVEGSGMFAVELDAYQTERRIDADCVPSQRLEQ